MNFLSHFFLDRKVTHPHFIVGVCTPDLVSLYNREIRIKQLPLMSHPSPDYLTFYQGVLRHFETDRIFHNCEFFHTQTAYISQFLKAEFTDKGMKRAFFVAHVLLELMIDKVLIQQDANLVKDFYTHFETLGIPEIAHLTEAVVSKPTQQYSDFLGRFISHKYLFHYSEYEYIVYVLKRIVRRVNIEEVNYMDSPEFLAFLVSYEQALTPQIAGLYDYLHKKISLLQM